MLIAYASYVGSLFVTSRIFSCLIVCSTKSDTCWLNTNTPGLTYGLRGVAYFHVTISGPGADLHSGFGGSVFEPMTDLIALMSKLVTSDARILIPGIYDGVKPASEEEMYVLCRDTGETKRNETNLGMPTANCTTKLISP